MQKRHLVAAAGISLRQEGHSAVGAGSGGLIPRRRTSAWSGLTTKKNTTVAVIKKVTSALMKRPYWNFELLMLKASF